jgi:protein-S-isoprenylcysteine O-methyltransferase Ste14
MVLEGPAMRVKDLVGSGDRIVLATSPFVVVGVVLNVAFPAFFSVGGPAGWLRFVSIAALAIGLVVWAWSVVLLLTRVPRGALITSGPYAVVRHPLYTGVALLVVPSIGFLLNIWLGAALGIVLYLAARRYEPAEDEELAARFGPAWAAYADGVAVPWL